MARLSGKSKTNDLRALRAMSWEEYEEHLMRCAITRWFDEVIRA